MVGTRSVGIVGTGSYVPPNVLTNAELEKLVDTSDQWIRERTGILERRIVQSDVPTSELATKAALAALKDANIKPNAIELIIVATVTPDMMFPSTACIVQKNLGIRHCGAFDILAACSGFSYALEIGKNLIATQAYQTVLVIAADTLSKITDWTDRNTCILFGDGAGAVVLQPVSEGNGILGSVLGADGSVGELIDLPGGGSVYPASHKTIDDRLHYIRMKGKELFRLAVAAMGMATKQVLLQAGLTINDIQLFIPHQANIRIIEAVAKRLELPMEKIFLNVHKYGNTSAASTAIALDEAVRTDKIKDNDIIVLTAFGGGITWGATVIRWGK